MSAKWPEVKGMDYRWGFPMPSRMAREMKNIPEPERTELLRRLELATFSALTEYDIEKLPEVGDD